MYKGSIDTIHHCSIIYETDHTYVHELTWSHSAENNYKILARTKQNYELLKKIHKSTEKHVKIQHLSMFVSD